MASTDPGDWRQRIAELKEMAHHCDSLPPNIKHMIEQAWLASQQGQEAMARELLSRAMAKIQG